MIDVTRFNGKSFVLNAELIEVMEETPDTVITLTTGHKYVVKESVEEVYSKVITYKRNILVICMRLVQILSDNIYRILETWKGQLWI